MVELGYIGLLTGYAGSGYVNQVTAGVMLFRLATWIAIIPIGWFTVRPLAALGEARDGAADRGPRGVRGGGIHMMGAGVLAAIGASDCEELGSGLIAQPFNTWTSLAYVVAGVWIILRRRAWQLDPSATFFGLLVAANGVGAWPTTPPPTPPADGCTT